MREGNTLTVCINNRNHSAIDMNCTHPLGKLKVLSLVYADFKNQTQPLACPESVQGAKCSQTVNKGNLLSSNTVFTACSTISQCTAKIDDGRSRPRNCSSYNYFMANYECIQGKFTI